MIDQQGTGYDPEVTPFKGKSQGTDNTRTKQKLQSNSLAGSPLQSAASKRANNTELESQSLHFDSESDIDHEA